MFENSKWIAHSQQSQNFACYVFKRNFSINKQIKSAKLKITSLGCYVARINGERVGDFILAPGWTSNQRIQFQTYNVKNLLKDENEVKISLGEGWFKGRINPRNNEDFSDFSPAIICEIVIEYVDGEKYIIPSDECWESSLTNVTSSDIYNGERYDSNYIEKYYPVKIQQSPNLKIVKQQGEKITEHENLKVHKVIITPKGEKVYDFNQNLTGYPVIKFHAKKGDVVSLSFAEILDKDGNFYNENYRSAKSEYYYVAKDGINEYKPQFTFYGFRYVRVDVAPKTFDESCITATVIHSDMKRTGYLKSSNAKLNKLFNNIVWGQKGNFVDVPTDCPQRDERIGWLGDAQVFVRTASYNFNVEKFFNKWLTDLALDQKKYGVVPLFSPVCRGIPDKFSAAWSDAVTICPWQIYLTYGNPSILKRQYLSMKSYVDQIGKSTKVKNLWYGCWHYGDWLGLDAPEGSYKGSSDTDLIASAFYANSVKILINAGLILGKNVKKYEKLYNSIVKKFKKTFKTPKTQTECALVLYFNLTDEKEKIAKKLSEMIIDNGVKIKTGFVGTPYLLHALSNNGYTELAYDLLLQEEYPSWLYSVNQGATTIWEHWDGINDKGEIWSSDMNSFNHYAYGSVADWVYSVACGIKTVEEKPGFEEVIIAPTPTKKLNHLSAKIKTKHGTISSKWKKEGDSFSYEITTPVKAKIIIDGKEHVVQKGTYNF